VDVDLRPLPDLVPLSLRWRDLEQRADPSFFQSWTWIGSWLKALPNISGLRLLSLESGGRVVGLGLLGRCRLRRHGLMTVRSLFVHETGDPELDAITIEHNGLLIQRGLDETGIRAAIQTLSDRDSTWDELCISGVENGLAAVYRRGCAGLACRLLTRLEKPYFVVDLDRVRCQGGDYLSVLSANTRSQLRRTTREYEKRGPLGIHIARDIEEACAYFDELRALHQSHWSARGAPGAFSTRFAHDFHRHLIAAGLPRGEIQLAKITCGEDPIGYLYNVEHAGVVSNYQSGFRYTDNARLRPGLLAHRLLVEENLRRGARVYDFLMGNQRYKKSLATDEGRMCQLVVQRRRLRFKVEDLARRLLRR
jgi:CelD/BcsL family acetyltransferase involved in cellulose biosynthesis